MELKDITVGAKFKFPRPTALTGTYTRTGRMIPNHSEYVFVHEVGAPRDIFVCIESTEVIPADE